MKLRYLYFSISFLFLLTGCATEEKWREHLQAFVGRPVADVIVYKGEPSSTTVVDSDTKFYHYQWTNRVNPGFYCHYSYKAVKGVVETYTYRGNQCVAE